MKKQKSNALDDALAALCQAPAGSAAAQEAWDAMMTGAEAQRIMDRDYRRVCAGLPLGRSKKK